MKQFKPYLAVVFCVYALSACNIVNPEEVIPTYIEIDSVKVDNVAPTFHGSVLNNVKDVWLFVDNNLIGAYELPCKVPLAINQDAQVAIAAGIWDNGLSGTRARYPFYKLDTFTISPSAGNSFQHTMHTEYFNSTNFHLVEDFEQGNIFTKFIGDTTAVLSNDPNYRREGSRGLLIELTDSARDASIITFSGVPLPTNSQSYAELDYKGDVELRIKLLAEANSSSTQLFQILTVRERSDWNKIYINLSPYAVQFPNYTFKFIIETQLESGRSSGFVAIDNFKMISF